MDTWKVTSRGGGKPITTRLEAYWEVEGDPMSDDYTPDEIDAYDLLMRWYDRYGRKHPDGLIPIYWSIHGEGIFEYARFAFDHLRGEVEVENFLTFYKVPLNSKTGEPINWMTLPVVDKRWNSKRADKGGFIQEATCWKPGILQPFVYLGTLIEPLG